MIAIELGILDADLHLRVPAEEDSLPVVRQALRALGETVDAELDSLEDAELALTEACANVVEHAYGDADGEIEITLRSDESELHVAVRDFGKGLKDDSADSDGFGLAMIHAIARDVEIRGEGGTEIDMAFALGRADSTTVDGAIPGLEPAERIIRRLVAIVGGQVDLPTDRLMESLLVAELVARHALRRLVGERIEIGLDHDDSSFELTVGPLERGGAAAIVQDSEVPVFGSVVERLADSLETRESVVDGVECDHLVLRVAARDRSV